jgi:pimeloyl-ACP methyl ester carboxylesterase
MQRLTPVLIVLLFAGSPSFLGASEPSFKDLTPKLRQRVDRLARSYPPETVKQEGVNLAGGITGWLISRVSLTAEEEAEHANLLHKEITLVHRVEDTPRRARLLFRKLVDELPEYMTPRAYDYRLTVLSGKEPDAFSTGGGHVYVTVPLVKDLLAGGKRGEAALAFLLGRELGHTGLKHCRRGWQKVRLEEVAKRQLGPRIDEEVLRKALPVGVKVSGKILFFLYTRRQEYEADLFAFHLCGNAGIPEDRALDGLRYLSLCAYPRLLKDPTYRPDTERAESTWRYFLSRESSPLRRLHRLLLERDGKVENGDYGLFRYDRKSGKLTACADHSMGPGARPIILIHGLRGNKTTFTEFLTFLADHDEVAGRELLVFRYPNNESLTRSGRFLQHEIERVVRAPADASFICHSAGGLVLRYYVEKRGGKFDRAVFLGTPHLGSQVAKLKFLLDVVAFQKELKNGWRGALARSLPEGHGQVMHDLHPGSLFLRHLGQDPEQARRYHVFSGHYLGRFEATSLRVAFIAGKKLIKKYGTDRIKSPVLEYHLERWLDRLVLPAEVTRGDLLVTVKSAELKGAGKVTRTDLNHIELCKDEKVMQQVLESITGK